MGLYFSASSMHRRAACPGSAAAEAAYPYDDTQSVFALEGDNMHAEMMRFFDPNLRPIELTGEQIRSCERAFHLYERLAHQNGFEGLPELEQKFRSKLGFSVVIDLALVNDDRALIVDWKFGRGTVEAAESNWQLACAAVAAFEKLGVSEITVAVIQPRAEDPITAASYEGTPALLAASDNLAIVIRKCKADGAPRIPGEHCKYCRHAPNCEEAAAEVKALVQIQALPAQMDDETLAMFLDKAKCVKPVIDAIEGEAKKRLAEGRPLTGWKLRAGNRYRKIGAKDAWAVLKDLSPKEALPVFKENFWNTLEIPISEVDAIVGEHFGLTPNKAKDQVAILFGDRLEVKDGAPVLVRTK